LELRPRRQPITSGTRHHYRIETPAEVKSKEMVKVGKVLDNVIGDTYTGVVGSKHTSRDVAIKQESSLILYDLNMLGASKPRTMTVALKLNLAKESKVDLTTRLKQAQKSEAGPGEKNNFENESMCLVTKKPIWDKRLKSYSLNFYGRSRLPSTKSFQLVSWHSNPDDVLVQFAKFDKNKFTLDVGPVTPLQAFQIALSSVDRKLAID